MPITFPKQNLFFDVQADIRWTKGTMLKTPNTLPDEQPNDIIKKGLA
jgi:hypothetical protein